MLEQALRAEEQGLTLKEAVDRGDKMDRARDMGLTFTVEHLYYQVVESAFSKDKQIVKDLWRDMGFWYGKYFLSKGNEPFKTLSDATGIPDLRESISHRAGKKQSAGH